MIRNYRLTLFCTSSVQISLFWEISKSHPIFRLPTLRDSIVFGKNINFVASDLIGFSLFLFDETQQVWIRSLCFQCFFFRFCFVSFCLRQLSFINPYMSLFLNFSPFYSAFRRKNEHPLKLLQSAKARITSSPNAAKI